jgi:hypothetical protein
LRFIPPIALLIGGYLNNYKIDYAEIELRKHVKSEDGKWNNEEKVWELSYKNVLNLGLDDRIV